jgi:tRNA A37 methylthiotransferase MiaB
MNESDTEVVVSLLQENGYTRTADVEAADVILTNTCAVRDNAEQKVWQRLDMFNAEKRKRSKAGTKPVVGVLGCMAERLKTRLLEADKGVDLVVGPDAYRDLPRLLGELRGGTASYGVNVALSQEETYADIAPVREDPRRLAAYVSIMRGCNNMCSFCIVPHTRGRERSRPVATIEDEVRRLRDEGYREVTLLGQNVNSFHDAGTTGGADAAPAGAASTGAGAAAASAGGGYETAAGFSNMYKLRGGQGVRFTELLDRLTTLAPGVRFRFTSPHPKDYPDALLGLMRERPNLCKQVHLPAQSGSSRVLAAMRRGYTREAYLALAHRMREAIPGVALSSDFITGFCGEAEAEHEETLSLIREVGYEQAYMFAYSLRERTHAAYHLQDDVPEAVKQRRLQEVIATFREGAAARNAAEVGRLHLVLVEGPARRSSAEVPQVSGRTDTFKRVVLRDAAVPATLSDVEGAPAFDVRQLLPHHHLGHAAAGAAVGAGGEAQAGARALASGDFVACRVTQAGPMSLHATPLLRLSGGLQDPAWAALQALWPTADAGLPLVSGTGAIFAAAATPHSLHVSGVAGVSPG